MRKLVILGLASSILLVILPTVLPAATQSPEELYGEYITPETRAILERSELLEQEIQAARAADKAMKTMALAFLIVGALIVGSIYLLRKKGDG